MKNSIKKISISLMTGAVILGSVGSVNAQTLNFSTKCDTSKLPSSNKIVYYSKNNNVSNTTPTKVPTKPSTNTQTQNPTTPTTPTQNTQEQSAPTSVSSIESEVVRLVNIERSKQGLAPLKMSAELSKVARAKSQDMADKNYFSHTSPTYGSPFDMMKQFGISYTAAGENIGKGYDSAQSVVTGWMNSPGHKANILSPKFGTIGVGYVNKSGTTYWTQMFTN